MRRVGQSARVGAFVAPLACTHPPVTLATFVRRRHRVPRATPIGGFEEGRLMRRPTTFLLGLIGRRRADSPGWWAYFGSFGDDIFGDAEYVD